MKTIKFAIGETEYVWTDEGNGVGFVKNLSDGFSFTCSYNELQSDLDVIKKYYCVVMLH